MFKNAILRLINEPAVTVGVLVAALNGATVQTWQGYASAAAVALLRFVVTGPLTAISQGESEPEAEWRS